MYCTYFNIMDAGTPYHFKPMFEMGQRTQHLKEFLQKQIRNFWMKRLVSDNEGLQVNDDGPCTRFVAVNMPILGCKH